MLETLSNTTKHNSNHSYVEPLVDNVSSVISHRKYQQGNTDAINDWVRTQLVTAAAASGGGGNAGGNAGVYCVGLDEKRPGAGYIAFGGGGPASNIYREWFNITPKGMCEEGVM